MAISLNTEAGYASPHERSVVGACDANGLPAVAKRPAGDLPLFSGFWASILKAHQ